MTKYADVRSVNMSKYQKPLLSKEDIKRINNFFRKQTGMTPNKMSKQELAMMVCNVASQYVKLSKDHRHGAKIWLAMVRQRDFFKERVKYYKSKCDDNCSECEELEDK